MVLSVSQQVMLSVSFALCLCVLMPRIFGSGGRVEPSANPDTRRVPHVHDRSPRESHSKEHKSTGGTEKKVFTSVQQMRSAMEQELKSEKASGNGRSMAFTLMPLYAIGVAVFAAYKFSKLKSEEKSQSKTEKEVAGKKSKETENQLLELEHHLAQTEQMLSALLTELDPISNCVNSLGNEQKGDLMNQLQSIRQLMKKSGMNTSSLSHPANQNCSDALENLIHSFEEQEAKPSNGEDVDAECEKLINNREETDSQCESLTEDLDIQTPVNDQEDDQCGTDLTLNNTYEGLRQRNIKDYLQSTN